MNKFLIANWKMNLGPSKAKELASKLSSLELKNTELWITPVSVCIPSVIDSVKNSKIKVGSQNVFYKENGAYTGEIAPEMLKELGCIYSLVGHSERRTLFKEANAESTKRTLGALKAGLKVVYCIGETQEKRECEETNDVLSGQLIELLNNINESDYENLIIAYEPVWAIGTGLVATTEQIAETHKFIRDFTLAKTKFEFPILYGGSVKPENYQEIISIENVSGALVGGASLEFDKLSKLVEISNSLN
jgi:triosephosphate isomerase